MRLITRTIYRVPKIIIYYFHLSECSRSTIREISCSAIYRISTRPRRIWWPWPPTRGSRRDKYVLPTVRSCFAINTIVLSTGFGTRHRTSARHCDQVGRPNVRQQLHGVRDIRCNFGRAQHRHNRAGRAHPKKVRFARAEPPSKRKICVLCIVYTIFKLVRFCSQ